MWTRKSADQGFANAQNMLGWMYAQGKGVPPDNIQAIKWFILAKKSGSTEVEQNLIAGEQRATPAQIAEAQKLAHEWWLAHHREE
jgi:TPR repeat protein